jgi:uncharacterized protein involved in outer membrane biogenesis
VDGIRRGDVLMSFHARELDAGFATLHTVAGRIVVDHGILTIPNLAATISDGRVSAQIKFDARQEIPKATLGMTFSNVRLGQFSRKDPSQPPMDGLLQGRLDLRGRGRSIHEIIADADGTVTATLSQGMLRASLAELIGLDLRALGLMLTNNKEDAPVRCGVVHFQARAGTLTAATLVLDTDPMVITGRGSIQLGTEQLDLQLQGQPKHVRLLRLQAPVSIHGMLKHPAVGVQKADRKFKLVDLGHGRDVDCSALLAEVKADSGYPERVPGEAAVPSER